MKKKFAVSFQGLWVAFCDPSVRLQFILGLITIAAGLLLNFETVEWLLVIVCIGFVIAAEIFNTCIERLCDFVQPEQDERIGRIKDMSSAAVLVTAMTSLWIGGIILIRHLI